MIHRISLESKIICMAKRRVFLEFTDCSGSEQITDSKLSAITNIDSANSKRKGFGQRILGTILGWAWNGRDIFRHVFLWGFQSGIKLGYRLYVGGGHVRRGGAYHHTRYLHLCLSTV